MKILKITAAVISILVAVGIVYLFFADFGSYKPKIEAAVTSATGREFHIHGDLSIRALPSPSASMQDVTLANASWADEPSMLEIGDLSVELGFWSLLFGPMVVKDLQLHDVSVLLETGADGATNTDFAGSEEHPPVEEEQAGGGQPQLVLRNADIGNVTVRLRQPGAEDQMFSLASLTVATDDLDRQVIDGSAELLDRQLSIDGIISEEQADINASFGNIRYHSVTRHREAEADLDITVSQLTDVGDLLQISDLPAEDLTLSGNVALRGDSVLLSGITIGVATARLVIDGELDGMAKKGRFELSIDAPSLAALGQYPDIPMTGNATLTLAENSVSLEPFAANFGESDIAGTLSSVGGDSPKLSVQANSTLIDLRPFTADEAADEQPDEAAADEAAETKGQESPYVFGEEPLPLETLRALNVDVDIAIDRVLRQTSSSRDFSLLVNASDGEITLDNSFKGGRAGDFENQVELLAGESSAELVVKAQATGLKLGALSGQDTPDELVPTTDLSLDITASGASPRQLAASTDGKLLITQGPGRIKNDLIGKISGDLLAQLFSALNPFSKEEEYSNWDCSIFAIDFDSGEGDIEGFLLQGEKIMVVGGGKIDLNTEKLNIEFNTKPRAGVGVSADMFVTPFVSLSGTLANPGVGVNAKGVLLEGGLALATGGLSFLYKGMLDRATAEADQCAKVLEDIGAE